MSTSKTFKIKQKVFWKWLGREIHGHVVSVHLEPITKVIKEKSIKRNGSKENPAYVVESEAGNLALKLQSELFAVMVKAKAKTPKMFD